MRCWSCRASIREKAVDGNSILRGRERSRGGPYRLYRCPRCLRENKIEKNGRGRSFASPPKEISLLDYLFGWIDPLAPEDYLRIVEWQEEKGEARRTFFEAGGDRRYSGPALRRLIRRATSFFRRGSRGNEDSSASRRAAESPRKRSPSLAGVSAGASPPPNDRTPRPRGVPHPYRILGISTDASDEEIRAAFRDLARRWHPDKQRDPDQVEEATRRWKELMRAYEVISSRRRGTPRPTPIDESDQKGSP